MCSKPCIAGPGRHGVQDNLLRLERVLTKFCLDIAQEEDRRGRGKMHS
jgi:hypothetical protein